MRLDTSSRAFNALSEARTVVATNSQGLRQILHIKDWKILNITASFL